MTKSSKVIFWLSVLLMFSLLMNLGQFLRANSANKKAGISLSDEVTFVVPGNISLDELRYRLAVFTSGPVSIISAVPFDVQVGPINYRGTFGGFLRELERKCGIQTQFHQESGRIDILSITENPPATPAPLLDFLSHPPPSDAQKLYIQGGDETDISAWKWRSKFYIRTSVPIASAGSRWDGFLKNDEGLTVYVFSKMPTVLIAVDDNGAPHELRVSEGIPQIADDTNKE